MGSHLTPPFRARGFYVFYYILVIGIGKRQISSQIAVKARLISSFECSIAKTEALNSLKFTRLMKSYNHRQRKKNVIIDEKILFIEIPQ